MPGQPGRSAAPRTARRGRGSGEAEEDPKGRWLTTYADAITLLMAFFVMLYAMSEIDVIKFTAFLQGLRVPFGNEAGDGTLPLGDGLLPEIAIVPPGEPDDRPMNPSRFIERVEGEDDAEDDGSQPDEHEGHPDEQDEPGGTDAEHEEGSPDSDELLALIEELEAEQDHRDLDAVEQQMLDDAQRLAEMEAQMDQVQDALTTALQVEGVELHVDQRRTERGLVVTIASDDVLFALGSTDIDAIGAQIISVISDTLRDFPNDIQIEGHTCTVPLNRPGYTNWNLSTDRAVAVLSSMIEDYGLAPDRIGAVGYGEYRPFTSNDTAEGRARNRRVDVVVLLQEPEG